MQIKEGSIEVTIAKAVGSILEDIIVSSKKKLWIISPWVSPKYAELLVKKKE